MDILNLCLAGKEGYLKYILIMSKKLHTQYDYQLICHVNQLHLI